jgi:hypothetical protein
LKKYNKEFNDKFENLLRKEWIKNGGNKIKC